LDREKFENAREKDYPLCCKICPVKGNISCEDICPDKFEIKHNKKGNFNEKFKNQEEDL